jgi:hypothetical protein
MTGGRPVDEPTRGGFEEITSGSSVSGSWGRTVGLGEGVRTDSGSLPVGATLELEGGGGGGRSSISSDEEGAEEGTMGDARPLPVPGTRSVEAGMGVTTIS